MTVIDRKLIVDDKTKEIAEKLYDYPDGIHETISFVAKKYKGEIVGVIYIAESRSENDRTDVSAPTLTRLGGIFVPENHRGKGYAKELLLWLINNHDAVESNLLSTELGESLWRSIRVPGIIVIYSKNPEYGHIAYCKR